MKFWKSKMQEAVITLMLIQMFVGLQTVEMTTVTVTPSTSLPSVTTTATSSSASPSGSLPSATPIVSSTQSSTPSVTKSTTSSSVSPSTTLPSATLLSTTTAIASSSPSLSSASSPGLSSSLEAVTTSATPSSASPSGSQSTTTATTTASSSLSSPRVTPSSQSSGTVATTATSSNPATTTPLSSGSSTLVATTSTPTSTPSIPSTTQTLETSSAVLSTTQHTSSTPLIPSTTQTLETSSAVLSTTQPTSSTPLVPSKTQTPESSSTISSTTQPASSNDTTPDIYIEMTFSIPWGRFCYLTTLFKVTLSKDLIEMDDLQFHLVSAKRIKLMNEDVVCKNKTRHNENAVLKFYISNSEEDLGEKDVNKDTTKKAYCILHNYWVSQTMALLDKVFENKVEDVQLKAPPDTTVSCVAEFEEGERIGIGIGVALVVVLLVILIYIIPQQCKQTKAKAKTKAKERRIIFANRAAIAKEKQTNGTAETDGPPPEGSLRDGTPGNEIEEVIVHTPVVVPRVQESGNGPEEQENEPVLSAISDYEAEHTEEEQVPGAAPLAKPEPDSVSEGEPTRAPEESEAVITPENKFSTSEPQATEVSTPAAETENVDKQTSPEENKPSTSEPVAIVVQPPEDETEDLDKQTSPEEDSPAPDDKSKPDFDQATDDNTDPNQAAINLGFDGDDDEENEEDEETKF